MSHSKPPLRLRGSVFFESPWNIQITAGVISDHVFAGVPFTDEVPGLCDEVPAVALRKEIFGLTAVLCGMEDGERAQFTLEVSPSEALRRRLNPKDETVDIGRWLSQLVGSVPEFKVNGCSPV